MIDIQPFRALRANETLAPRVAALPYDVCNVQEAKAYKEDPYHFYHITRSEIDMADGIDVHAPEVYEKAKKNLDEFIRKGYLQQDMQPAYFLYRLTMNGRSQTGLLCASSLADYRNGKIKKHEFTRPEKEKDRIDHMKALGAQTGVVFLAYRDVQEMNDLVAKQVSGQEPVYDFTSEDGVQHMVWGIYDSELVDRITRIFKEKVPATYIADGHHRAASAEKVGMSEPDNTEAQYFLTCIFPESELTILDYNRVVKDLNGLSKEAFIARLQEDFDLTEAPIAPYRPQQPHIFGMYLDGHWYVLKAKVGTFELDDPILRLDVQILQNNVLSKILGIHDPRTDVRVEFVGGIRGLKELEKRVDNGEMAAAFACHPVTLGQLFDVADSGAVMPPKSTWFEPKTRDGLVSYVFRK